MTGNNHVDKLQRQNARRYGGRYCFVSGYLGCWPERGNSGITDIYAFGGEWFNLPEGVLIVGWMPIPDTAHLPIAEHYKGSKISSAPRNFLGCVVDSVETDAPEIFEGIFEGDFSQIKRS